MITCTGGKGYAVPTKALIAALAAKYGLNVVFDLYDSEAMKICFECDYDVMVVWGKDSSNKCVKHNHYYDRRDLTASMDYWEKYIIIPIIGMLKRKEEAEMKQALAKKERLEIDDIWASTVAALGDLPNG